MNFDLNYFTQDELTEIDNLKNNNNFNFYNLLKQIDDVTIHNLFENISNEKTILNSVVLEKYNKWIEFFSLSLLVNCGFVNYDENANNQLKELMNSFNNYKLNLVL